MAILGIKADFKTRKHRLNWLVDRFDVLLDMDPVKMKVMYHKIITLKEPIEAIKRNM